MIRKTSGSFGHVAHLLAQTLAILLPNSTSMTWRTIGLASIESFTAIHQRSV